MTQTDTHTISDEDYRLCAANQLGAPLASYRLKLEAFRLSDRMSLFTLIMSVVVLMLDLLMPRPNSPGFFRFADFLCTFLMGTTLSIQARGARNMRVVVCAYGLLQVKKTLMWAHVDVVRWQDIASFTKDAYPSGISIGYRRDGKLRFDSLAFSKDYQDLDALAARIEEHRQQFRPFNWKELFVPPEDGGKYHCPCCRYRTLKERGEYEICAVCGWQDDGQDNGDADINRPLSPNHMSLSLARENYQRFGAIQKSALEAVRPPLPEEM